MNNELLNFRLAYLRFISRVWRDQSYLFYLAVEENGFLITSSNIDSDFYYLLNLTKILEDHFEYKSGWNVQFELRIPMQMKNKGEPVFDRQYEVWRGPNDRYIFNIPIWSGDINWSKCAGWPVEENSFDESRNNFISTQKAEALAALYNGSPTIFGRKFADKTTGGTIPEKINKAKDNSVDTANIPASGTSEDLDKFLEFGMLIPRVIELAWNNEIFRNKLFEQNKNGKSGDNNVFNEDIDKTRLLSSYFGFNSPWNFDIIFKETKLTISSDKNDCEDNAFIWVPGESTAVTSLIPELRINLGTRGELYYKKNGKVGSEFPPNIVRLNFPGIYDTHNAINYPQALNAYNCTGPAYPFTCI